LKINQHVAAITVALAMTTLVGCSAHTATPLKTSEPTGPLKVSAVSLRFSAPSVERLRLLSGERVAYTRKAIGSQELVVRSLSTGVINVVARLANPGIFQWLATEGNWLVWTSQDHERWTGEAVVWLRRRL
jgi:hypothetical protein